MTPAALTSLAMTASIVLTVFVLGITSEPQDTIYLLRQPLRLLRSLLSMNIIMPACAVALALAFDLRPAVKLALVALAVSPVPPTLPKKQIKAGGRASYAIGLLVVEAVLAIVFVPAVVPVLGRIFHVAAQIRVSAVAMRVVETILVPLAAGMLASGLAPALAKRISGPAVLAGTLLLLIGLATNLFAALSDIGSLVGNGTVAAIAAFSIVGVAVGHLLGGPHTDDRAVLALSSATRHPGVAQAIAAAHVAHPAEVKMVWAAILLFNIVGGLVTRPYLRWITPRTAKCAAESR